MRNLFLFLLGAIIVIPALEIWLFIEIGGWIGALPTIMLVFLSAVLGAYFARREGWNTYRLAMIQMQNGELPGEALLDGACILSGGILLITPGFLRMRPVFFWSFLIPVRLSSIGSSDG